MTLSRTSWALGFVLPLLAGGLLFSAAPPVPKKAPAPPKVAAPKFEDHLDYVFVGSDRPVLLKVWIEAGGRPYHADWTDYVKKWFAHFDRNGDGVLTKNEVEGRVPNGNYLQSHLQGSIGNNLRGQTATFVELDTDKDGKVTLEEFTAYYRRANFAPLRFSNNSSAANTKAVNDLIYHHLDVNKDGKLSKEELARGPEVLRKLDEDEDEVFSLEELTPRRNSGGFIAAPVALERNLRYVAPVAPGGLLEVRPGSFETVARQLVAAYDKNKDGKLSREEINLDKEQFDRLDANRDGQLDLKELARFFDRPADLELVVRAGNLKGLGGLIGRIGITRAQPKRVDVFNPKKRAMAGAAALKRLDDNAVSLTFGDARVELQANDNQGGRGRYQNTRRFYLEQFKALDFKDRGYVELAQEKENQGAPFLFQIFPMADKNGNGKLTRKELTGFLDLQEQGSDCFVTLQVNDTGRSLFDLLDENGDRRLSVREFRTAWERAGPLARHPAGIAQDDVPRRITVSVVQGNRFFFRPTPFGGSTSMRTRGKALGPVPAWFTKMDRNSDGDLSPKEFLGTQEEFRMLDADGDGLIGADEARAYEARRKKAEGAKKR